MEVATGWSTKEGESAAVRESYGMVRERLGGPPDFLLLHATERYDPEGLLAEARRLAPGIPLHGGTSCQGVMTERGFHSEDGRALGLLGIRDPGGAYGTGAALLGGDPQTATVEAVERALEAAGEEGVVPDMIWITAAPGNEERCIEAIEEHLGGGVPIAGGSSADNTVSGGWRQFANDEIFKNAVVVSALFPSGEVMFAFHSGYEPDVRHGTVTRAEGRILHEIGGRPAAEVYDEWTGGKLSPLLARPGNILAHTTLHPLGRVVGHIGGQPYFHLSHPDRVLPGGAISLFTRIEEGEEIWAMRGTPENLVRRAGRVAASALETYDTDPDEVSGALVIYCAGCMLTVTSEMNRVAEGIGEAIGNAPFLGTFTFGEQGCFPGGENRHGNLMISLLVFGNREKGSRPDGTGSAS